MFRNLFRPKWESPKSQLRQQAIAAFQEDNPEHAGLLLKLAREDSEPAVRRDAVQKIGDLDVLTQIARKDLEAIVRDAANQRILDLLGGKSALSPDLDERLRRLAQISSPLLLTTLIREAVEIDIKQAAVEQLGDEMYLEDIALHSSIARLRQAAAEKISTPAILQSLADAAKVKDKSVYRIAKDKLDAHQRLQKDALQQSARIVSLCEQMESHARAAINPLYAAKAISLAEQWATLADEVDAATSERFEAARDLANQRIAELHEAEEKEKAIESARIEALASLKALEEALTELKAGDGSHYDIPSLAALVATQEVRWAEAVSGIDTHKDLDIAFRKSLETLKALQSSLEDLHSAKTTIEGLQDRVESSLDSAEAMSALEKEASELLRRLPFNDDFPRPTLINTLRNIPQRIAFARIQQKGLLPANQNNDRDMLQRAVSLLEAGSTKEASQLVQALQHQIRFRADAPDAALLTGISDIEMRLKEMREWRRFAVIPKKEELCKEMESLAISPLEPPAQSVRIQELRDAWKALGVVDHRAEQGLWDTFQSQAEKAYEHCKSWIEAQRQIKLTNLETRRTLVSRAQELLERVLQENCDWKPVRKDIKAIRDAWTQAWPVDHKAGKKADGEFRQLTRRIEDAIQSEERRNAERMASLVDKARGALALSTTEGTALIRQLQEEWKKTGITSARENHKNWPLFREACDAVFTRLNEERDANRRDLDERRHSAESLCNEVASIDVSVAGWRELLEQKKAAFDALGLPQREGAHKRFEKASLALHEQAKARNLKQNQVARQHLVELLKMADEGTHTDNAGELLDLLDRKWEQHMRFGLGLEERMSVSTRRDLLLRLESRLGLDSPEQDLERRREIQMQALVQSGLHGKNQGTVEDDIRELLLPASGTQDELEELRIRIAACLESAGVNPSKR